MAWNVKFDDGNKIVALTYSGLISPVELDNAFLAAFSLSSKENTNLFLADCTEMIGGHSVIDLYALIDLFDAHGVSREMKEARILSSMESSSEDIHFYETACINRGFNVKLFKTAQDAITWLTS